MTYSEAKNYLLHCIDEAKSKDWASGIKFALATIEKATERYKPITLQERDAEPRRLKAILDVETNDIYILKTTKGFAEEYMGMTIEDREADKKTDDYYRGAQEEY